MFADLTFEWQGKKGSIPSNKLLGAIARVEEVITLGEIGAISSTGKMPLARVSQAYGALIRYAGIDATDEDVYESMFGEEAKNNIVGAIVGLMLLMVPPSQRNKTPEDKQPANPSHPTTALLSSSTKRQSGNSRSSRRRSSGNLQSPNSGG